jgi:transposase InsO family protein
MTTNLDITKTAVSLVIKAALLSAQWSGKARRRGLEKLVAMDADAKDKELLFLRDKVHQLQTQVSILQKRIRKREKCPRYTLRERLFILCHMETFQIPRRRVTEYFGIARSTLYRWLHQIDGEKKSPTEPANKTPMEIAALVWEITKANVDWGRVRIANQLALLNIFIAASTVRNILNRPNPRKPVVKASHVDSAEEETEPRSIPAWYPNHVWSVDCTTFPIWGLWPIHIFVAIDHYSRKVVAVAPLEGPNSGWTIDALEQAFEKYGPPKHLIMDHAPIFIGSAFSELLNKWDVKPRFGAVGKQGSIAVTERVIKTVKYEWLKRVPVIRGFDHLTRLCDEFVEWYNEWRPHMTLDGARPDDVYSGDEFRRPDRDKKKVPRNIERRVFRATRVTGYRLKEAA